MWPAGGNGTAGLRVVIERADTGVPSYLASRAPVPHTPLLLRQGLSLWGLTESSHWPGSWYRGRKGSSENGAFSRSTPRSRSMQHLRESRVCRPRQNSGLSTSTTCAEHTTVSCPSCSSNCSTWFGGPGARSPAEAFRTFFSNLWLGSKGYGYHSPQWASPH